MSDYQHGFYDGQIWSDAQQSASNLARSLFDHSPSIEQLRSQIANERIARDIARAVQAGLISGLRAISQSLPADQKLVALRSVMIAFEPAFRKQARTLGIEDARVEAHIEGIKRSIASMLSD